MFYNVKHTLKNAKPNKKYIQNNHQHVVTIEPTQLTV